MKLLTVTTLFPNKEQPSHGIFVATRLEQLRKRHADVEITVLAPVPWFPFRNTCFGQYSRYARVPRVERVKGMLVFHPRYLVIPKIGMLLTPVTLWLSLWLFTRRVLSKRQFDLIDGHYIYPDGISISWLAAQLNRPCTLTARGTDLNLIPQFSLPRRLIKNALKRSQKIICVCDALRDVAVQLGAKNHAITLRNGVDLKRFTPADDRSSLRQTLAMRRCSLLSVGHLIERKGHHLVIEAIKTLPDIDLYIAGDGEERSRLEQQVAQLGLQSRVHFLGALKQEALIQYYQAADLLILASSREGWANVLLESMACGTPVVATRVWGTPEVVQTDHVGQLAERTPAALLSAITAMIEQPRDRQRVRDYAESFDWNETSDGLYTCFKELIA